MNMKLLDLQTGKYLELGKDWLYGKNKILICPICDGTGFEKSPLPMKHYLFFKEQPHTNPIINKSAEKTGAVIYGGRYILLENAICENRDFTIGDITESDIYRVKSKSAILMVKLCIFNNRFYSELGLYESLQSKYITNIFEEFSKKEQGLEIEFDELKEFFK